MDSTSNRSSLLHHIQNDILNWSVIAKVRPSEEVEIVVDSQTHTDSVRIKTPEQPVGYRESLWRLVSRKYHATISDPAATVEWLRDARNNTSLHVHDLLGRVNELSETNPSIAEEAVKILAELKKTLEGVSAEGYAILGQNIKLITKDETLGEKIENERNKIHETLIETVSSAILTLGTSLYARKLQDELSVEKEVSTGWLNLGDESGLNMVDESFATLHEEKETEGAPLPFAPSASTYLVDEHFEERWEAKRKFIVEENGFLNSIYQRNPEIDAPLDQPGQMLQGKKNDINLVVITNEKGEEALVPKQFMLDLPRMEGFYINGELAYSNKKKFRYDDVSAYKQLAAFMAPYDVSEERGRLAERIACLTTQGFFADLTGKIMLLYSTEDKTLIPLGSGQFYSIDVVKNKVRITLRISLVLRDPATEVPPSAIIVKRVVEIPIEELNDPDLKISAKPVPGLTMKDTFSESLSSPEFAEEMIPFFD